MNIVLKNIDEKTKNFRISKNQKQTIENTKKFCKKYSIKIIDNRIDYLTLKIWVKNSNTINLENYLSLVYDYETIQNKQNKIEHLQNINISDKFYIINNWLAFWNQKKIYSIYDKDKNKIAQLILKNESNLKKNRNVINSLEFKWLFFKCYKEYLQDFFLFFWISTKDKDIIKRIDYCIDLQWIEVFELLEYLKDIYKKSKNVNSLTATDKKILQENNSDITYWRAITYKNFFSNYNDLKIYDKILDILENYKNRKVNWKNPYADYLSSDFPITRIELKKKKFTNLTDNSIKWVFQNIESLFFDYLLRFFVINLSFYIWINNTLNWKKVFLAKEQKSKSLFHSITMALAYLNNIKELAWENELYKFLYKNFPELENIKPIDLIDEIWLSDFFTWISDDLL